MASKTVIFEKENSIPKEAPVGFSWTSLFFGFWPAFMRKDFKTAFKWIGIGLITLSLGWFVYPFMFNKQHIKRLLADGYKAKSVSFGTIEDVEKELQLKLQ